MCKCTFQIRKIIVCMQVLYLATFPVLQSSIPGSGRSLEKGMATHSSTFAWRSPWTEEPGRIQSISNWTENGHAHFHSQDCALHKGSLWPHPCQHWALTGGKDLQTWHVVSEKKQREGHFFASLLRRGFIFRNLWQLLSHYLPHSLLHTKWSYYHNCYCSSRPPTPAVSPSLLPSRPLHYISFPHTLVLILTVHQGPDQRSLFQEGSQGDMSVVSHNSYSLPSSCILLVDFSWNCACLHN